MIVPLNARSEKVRPLSAACPGIYTVYSTLAWTLRALDLQPIIGIWRDWIHACKCVRPRHHAETARFTKRSNGPPCIWVLSMHNGIPLPTGTSSRVLGARLIPKLTEGDIPDPPSSQLTE
jgi:hypothetical protein